jgi:hypothetical protein
MKKVINQGLGPIRYNSIAYKLQVVYKIILWILQINSNDLITLQII